MSILEQLVSPVQVSPRKQLCIPPETDDAVTELIKPLMGIVT